MQSHTAAVLESMLRNNDPNLAHNDTLQDIASLKHSGLLYTFGVFRGTPQRFTRERRRLAKILADLLHTL